MALRWFTYSDRIKCVYLKKDRKYDPTWQVYVCVDGHIHSYGRQRITAGSWQFYRINDRSWHGRAEDSDWLNEIG